LRGIPETDRVDEDLEHVALDLRGSERQTLDLRQDLGVDEDELVATVNGLWLVGRHDAAVELAAVAAEEAPEEASAWVALADAQRASGDLDAAREALERATGVRLLHFDEVDYFNDLEELLAILEACDILITTSNVNAHLAGALGRRVWLLYLADNPPFHYWAHDGGYRSLWYPAVEIVSAPQLTEWAAVIRYAVEKLARLQSGDGA
jgi:tetratricopeptide (TPR) repeat protein